MKSIVLCERTLVKESEYFSDLKEGKINEEGNEKGEEKKILNGALDSENSEVHIGDSAKDKITFPNGVVRSSETSSAGKDRKNDEEEQRPSVPKRKDSVNTLTSQMDTSAEIVSANLSSDRDETEDSVERNLLSESEILNNLNSQDRSSNIREPSLKTEMDFSGENNATDDDTVQIIESETSSEDIDQTSMKDNLLTLSIEERKLKEVESEKSLWDKDKQTMESIGLDLDENKENEKEEKAVALQDYCGSDLLNKVSSECEIQVGEVQTISGIEKDSIWSESDLKKSEQDLKEKKNTGQWQDISISSEESVNVTEGDKEEEGRELGSDESVVLEPEENPEERMNIEIEEFEPAVELKLEEKESEQPDLDNFSGNKNVASSENTANATDGAKKESTVYRKRHIPQTDEDETDLLSKKKRLLESGPELDQVQLEESTGDSSRRESHASLDATNASSEGEFSTKSKVPITDRNSTDDKNPKKLKTANADEEAKDSERPRAEAMFSILENFRGTLSTLTRSDLEELIVQKLCEVITERSNVGELRRKAQALEQDQERWKTKAQSLTKQMKEMEMVMKKYMNEVQKQIKEGETHVVTPLKVTRSVGLQVSFYSSANKGPKTYMPAAPAQNLNAKNAKITPPKLSTQSSPVTQNMRNKPTSPYQKSSPSPQKFPVSQPRRPIIPKPDYGSSPLNRPVVQQSLLNNNRGIPNQVQIPKINYKPVAGAMPQQCQQQQPHQQQQHQQQQQNGSKVIDLTEDDDRQAGNIVKASGPIRVVNHLPQPPASHNSRFAYLLPTTSAPTGSSVGQSRQVLIATPTMPQPNRQIMCSMPPLLFKGGNAVQSGSQPQMVNQSNKVSVSKALRHPAPLPQRPINQNTRPSLKLLPPRPALKISKVQTGIVLSWNMSLSPEHAPIASYQLYAYQESDSPPATSLWKKVGDVKALPLPMACTLTQFMSGHKYHFAVRAVDLHSRIGPFSFPGTIVLV